MFELQLLCPEAKVDIFTEAAMELGAVSVSVEDADAGTTTERALFGEPNMPIEHTTWEHSRLSALFQDEATAREALDILSLQDFFENCRTIGIVAVPEQDWVRITQSQFAPVPVTESFFIVPTWCEPPPAAQQIIRLDPGLAFGTGTHPTTLMCLKWIAQQNEQGHALGHTLDYGCGSGILAIAAKKLGASKVCGVDIDPAAVTASQANAQMNAVTLKLGLPSLAQGTYDTVLANILASPLKVLAPLLCNHVAAGGHLVLAGILERQTEELIAAYAPYVTLKVADTLDGWVLMTAHKN
ncbi:MAG: 50S ribosomal protein L11 methyltransferase [Cytophagales bacterium]|nr:50S ribosomal protein L11 methyltransferase [Cytophagales bacterium]